MNDKTQYDACCAVVVDDEPLPRAHLIHLLREAGVGEVRPADSAATCLSFFDGEDDRPDWVFLDVRMPGMDGLMLADALGAGQIAAAGQEPQEPPAIVFVTGYEDYALPAFERAAVDYLLKPVERERLAVTLQRLAERRGPPAPPVLPVPTLQRLPIRMEYAVRLVDVADIVAASAGNKRVEVITRDATYTTYYTLAQLEQRLPADHFARVHDGWIVSLAEIIEIHNLGGQSYQLRLRTGDRLVPVSRRRLPLLQQRLGL
ncbi:MAG: response regulator transcription factor [Armatimonadetes bacterium]|nr:response regulator transcription factor [Armatimonadota bacterium]